ncbi:hypothetical protein L9F63_002141, partial [Diploptera punctata]
VNSHQTVLDLELNLGVSEVLLYKCQYTDMYRVSLEVKDDTLGLKIQSALRHRK